MSEWQPIKTAPKDGRLILYATADWVSVGRWNSEVDQWREINNHWTDTWGGEDFPTHWMPLPAPPAPHRENE